MVSVGPVLDPHKSNLGLRPRVLVQFSFTNCWRALPRTTRVKCRVPDLVSTVKDGTDKDSQYWPRFEEVVGQTGVVSVHPTCRLRRTEKSPRIPMSQRELGDLSRHTRRRWRPDVYVSFVRTSSRSYPIFLVHPPPLLSWLSLGYPSSPVLPSKPEKQGCLLQKLFEELLVCLKTFFNENDLYFTLLVVTF